MDVLGHSQLQTGVPLSPIEDQHDLLARICSYCPGKGVEFDRKRAQVHAGGQIDGGVILFQREARLPDAFHDQPMKHSNSIASNGEWMLRVKGAAFQVRVMSPPRQFFSSGEVPQAYGVI